MTRTRLRDLWVTVRALAALHGPCPSACSQRAGTTRSVFGTPPRVSPPRPWYSSSTRLWRSGRCWLTRYGDAERRPCPLPGLPICVQTAGQPATGLSFSHHAQLLASSHEDRHVRLWDPRVKGTSSGVGGYRVVWPPAEPAPACPNRTCVARGGGGTQRVSWSSCSCRATRPGSGAWPGRPPRNMRWRPEATTRRCASGTRAPPRRYSPLRPTRTRSGGRSMKPVHASPPRVRAG